MYAIKARYAGQELPRALSRFGLSHARAHYSGHGEMFRLF